jgi:hypothetical protein
MYDKFARKAVLSTRADKPALRFIHATVHPTKLHTLQAQRFYQMTDRYKSS